MNKRGPRILVEHLDEGETEHPTLAYFTLSRSCWPVAFLMWFIIHPDRSIKHLVSFTAFELCVIWHIPTCHMRQLASGSSYDLIRDSKECSAQSAIWPVHDSVVRKLVVRELSSAWSTSWPVCELSSSRLTSPRFGCPRVVQLASWGSVVEWLACRLLYL